MLTDQFEEAIVVPYKDIPGFPDTTVEGHVGHLVFGRMNGMDMVGMKGRFHIYEGHEPHTVGLPVRVMKRLGVQVIVVTNASGGLNPEFDVGDVMILTDHLAIPCMVGSNPLRGPNLDEFGERFVSVTDIYEPTIIERIRNAAKEAGCTEGLR